MTEPHRAARLVFTSAFFWIPVCLCAQSGFDGANLTTVPVHRAAPAAAGSGSSILSVGLSSFLPASSAVTYDQDPTESYWFQTSGTMVPWSARLTLPTGAVVESIDLDACDTSPTGALVFAMSMSPAGAKGSVNVTPFGSTGATPGCGLFSVTPSNPPLVIDNAAFNYWLFLGWFMDFSSALEVSGMRVHYHLQVSPDPAVATFTDVPVGHPQHRFVEALVAAGVTAGCGGGQYCPNAPVTRGQMAVFLSVALGLNWPN